MKQNTFNFSQNLSQDILQGPLAKKIFFFSVPLILSNLLQVLFNMSDMAVVGRFAGAASLGSVGSTAQLVFFFTGIVIGIASSVNVIVAFYIGRKNQKDITQTIQTAFIICLACGIVLLFVGVLCAQPILVLMHTKQDLLKEAVLYFKIYMLGMPALCVYNFAANVMAAALDTKRPLFYLCIAGVLNIILNLFFVIVCGMKAQGVALASCICQYVSCFLAIFALLKEKSNIKLILHHIKLNEYKALQILKLGLPAGLQNAVFAFANIFIQVGVNSFSSLVVAGNAIASNADPLVYETMAAFYAACATFIGQNYGSGNKKMVLKSFYISLFFAAATGLFIGLLLLSMGNNFLLLFTGDKAVMDCARQRLFIMSLSYWVAPFMDCTIAASRGLGKTVVPSIFVILGSCVFRILWIQTVFAYFKTIQSLFLLYIFSWGITAVAQIVYFAKVYKKTFLYTH